MTMAYLDAYVTDVTCQLHGWVQRHSMRRIVIMMDNDATDCSPILDKHQATDACRHNQHRLNLLQVFASASRDVHAHVHWHVAPGKHMGM